MSLSFGASAPSGAALELRVTGETGPRPVVDLIVGVGVKQLVDITINGETVTATEGHPFWVDDLGRWVDAGDLVAGDGLVSAHGDVVVIDAVVDRDRVATVHNLTVDGIHTFYVQVGDEPVLTHNCGSTHGMGQQLQLFDSGPYDLVPQTAPKPLGRGSTGPRSPYSLKE